MQKKKNHLASSSKKVGGAKEVRQEGEEFGRGNAEELIFFFNFFSK